MKNALIIFVVAAATSLLLPACYTVLDIELTPGQYHETYIPAPPPPIIIVQPVYEPIYFPPGSSAPMPAAPEPHRASGNQRSDERGNGGGDAHRASGSRRD